MNCLKTIGLFLLLLITLQGVAQYDTTEVDTSNLEEFKKNFLNRVGEFFDVEMLGHAIQSRRSVKADGLKDSLQSFSDRTAGALNLGGLSRIQIDEVWPNLLNRKKYYTVDGKVEADSNLQVLNVTNEFMIIGFKIQFDTVSAETYTVSITSSMDDSLTKKTQENGILGLTDTMDLHFINYFGNDTYSSPTDAPVSDAIISLFSFLDTALGPIYEKLFDSSAIAVDTTKISVIFKETIGQNAGFDPNSRNYYPTYDTLFNKPIVWKSLKQGVPDKIALEVDTLPKRVYICKDMNISTLSPINCNHNIEEISLLSNSSLIDMTIMARKDSLKGDSIGIFKAVSYPKVSRTLGIIYIHEENDDIQIVNTGDSTSSDTTVVVQCGPNEFLDSDTHINDSIVTLSNGNKAIVAGSDRIANSIAKNINTVTTVLPGNNAGLKSFLNKVYNPANVEFTSVGKVADLPVNFDLNKDGLVKTDASWFDTTKIAGVYRNKEFMSIKTSVEQLLDSIGDNFDYYCLVLDNSSRSGLLGKGALFRSSEDIFRFVLIVSDSHRGKVTTLYNTVAHELGHGAFDLEHPFHQSSIVAKGYTKGDDKANFMDYFDGDKSRKYQWDQVHDKDKLDP